MFKQETDKTEELELILTQLHGKEDSESVIKYIATLRQLGRFSDAISILDEMKIRTKIYAEFPHDLFLLHLTILLENNQFLKAKQTLEKYEELPYVNYEMEELFKKYQTVIHNAEITFCQKEKSLSLDETEQILRNFQTVSEDKLFLAIHRIKDSNIQQFLPILKVILKSKINEGLKTIILLLLVEQKIMENIIFIKDSTTYELVPYELDPPFTGSIYQKIVDELQKHSPNPGVFQMAFECLSELIIEMYPQTFDDDEVFLLVGALLVIATEMLNENLNVEQLCQNLGLENALFAAYIAEKKMVLSNIKKITF